MGTEEQSDAWWKHTTVYQVYPRSFADTNGDGVGDLRGVIGKLGYLGDLGVETVWLSPFFGSPQADFGYDVSDHLAIAPEYGTIDDCRELIDRAHGLGLKIVFDMVLNHTSAEHPWFRASRLSRDSPYRDYYLWRPGRGPRGERPPNNWRSMLGPSGWHRDEATGEWYWASFLPFQPDLNYRNPRVKQAMLGVVRHWLEQGVDGLRLDIFNALFKDASFTDNPWSPRPIPSESNPHGFFQRHTGTIDHPDTLAFARELRAVVDSVPGPPRFLVGEVFGDAATLRRYCGEADDAGLHMVFLFEAMRTPLTARAWRGLIEQFEQAFPPPEHVPTYVFGNHDRPRFIDRLGDHEGKAKLLATLQLTARGVPFIYYGEEIGSGHHGIPLSEGLDPIAARFRFVPGPLASFLRRFGILLNRDESRRPMAWDGTSSGGFTREGVMPWLPLHPRHRQVNVEAQERDPRSILACYRALLALRARTPALHAGRLELFPEGTTPRDVLGYRRAHGESEAWVYLNFARHPRVLELGPLSGRTRFSSRLCDAAPAGARLELAPHEGVVIV